MPHDKNGEPAVDDGAAFSVTSACGSAGSLTESTLKNGLGGDQQFESATPEHFRLLPNRPNPFNPETQIRFELLQASHVLLTVYNTIGQKIRVLADAQFSAGTHRLHWDGKNASGHSVPSGVYFYEMRAGNFIQLRKMTLLR